MKILTKKEQQQLLTDLIDLYTMGSDAFKSIGTNQPISKEQAIKRQMRMTEAAMRAANIIKGTGGGFLLMEVYKQKSELEQKQGFPLVIK